MKDQIRRSRADLAQRLADAARPLTVPHPRTRPPPDHHQHRPGHRHPRPLRLHRRARHHRRRRHLTFALPPRYAARLFNAQAAGAGEQRLRQGLKEMYFQKGGRRAGSLEEVRVTDVEHLEFELEQSGQVNAVIPGPRRSGTYGVLGASCGERNSAPLTRCMGRPVSGWPGKAFWTAGDCPAPGDVGSGHTARPVPGSLGTGRVGGPRVNTGHPGVRAVGCWGQSRTEPGVMVTGGAAPRQADLGRNAEITVPRQPGTSPGGFPWQKRPGHRRR